MLSPQEIDKLNYLIKTHPYGAVVREVIRPLVEADRLADAEYATELACTNSLSRSYYRARLPGLVLNSYFLPSLKADRLTLNKVIEAQLDRSIPVDFNSASWPEQARAYLASLRRG